MDMVLRAERVYNLLGVPQTVSVEGHIAVAATNSISIHALTNPNIERKCNDLKEFVKVIDDTLRKDLSTRQAAKIRPIGYKPNHHGSNFHEQDKNTNHNDKNGTQQINNSMHRDKNNTRTTIDLPDQRPCYSFQK